MCGSIKGLVNGGGMNQVSIPRLLYGGIDVNVFSVGKSLDDKHGIPTVKRCLKALNTINEQSMGMADTATNCQNIKQINKHHGLAIILHLTGASHNNDMKVLKDYYDLGVRIIHPPFDDKLSFDCTKREGLTKAGKATIEKMLELGMIVDVAHASQKEFWQICEMVKGPLINSHASCRGLFDHPRNLTDKQIAAIAEHGGVVGIGPFWIPKPYWCVCDKRVKSKWHAWEKIQQKSYQKWAQERPTGAKWWHAEARYIRQGGAPILRDSFACWVNHMDYIKERFGVNCIGFGPDFDYILGGPRGFEEVDKLPNLTYELMQRGYAFAEVKKILGGNFMRVFSKILE